MAAKKITLEVAGREVTVSNPDKVYFPRAGYTKLDLVRYYLSVAPGALEGVDGRPMALKRFVNGVEAEPFFQKRAPSNLPDWISTAELKFPSGRTADEIVLRDAAGLAWVVNLGCVDLNPHPVRVSDLDHPDELRVDLDPVPGVEWPAIRAVALVTREVLSDYGLTGWPKTSGSRGMHIYARIHPNWPFSDVRRAAVAVAREIERRAPDLATSKWWKEERHGVFLDYNQNAKDRTTCSAYSVRPLPDARVSAPLDWKEVPECDPADFTILSMPERFRQIGDPHAGINAAACSLERLLELAAKDDAEGIPDAPWPPHFRKMEGEAPRVMPSRRKSAASKPRVKMPLIVVAHSRDREAALAGLERWKSKHPEAAGYLAVDDVLVDSMRGRSSTWTRIRVNLRHVPEALRPPQETPDPDDDPTREWRGMARKAPRASKHA
jgi:bifunctional non-homologous end joining protein LigD